MMRTLCRLIFCGLALISFAVFIVKQLSTFNLSTDTLRFIIYTVLVTAALLALIWLAQRLWQERALIGRILFALWIILMLILVAILPEGRQWAASCVNALIEQPLAISVICVIICGFCYSWPARSSSTS